MAWGGELLLVSLRTQSEGGKGSGLRSRKGAGGGVRREHFTHITSLSSQPCEEAHKRVRGKPPISFEGEEIAAPMAKLTRSTLSVEGAKLALLVSKTCTGLPAPQES